MNHKRHKPKHQRAGCLWCKPWKDERNKGDREFQPVPVRRKLQPETGRYDNESSP